MALTLCPDWAVSSEQYEWTKLDPADVNVKAQVTSYLTLKVRYHLLNICIVFFRTSITQNRSSAAGSLSKRHSVNEERWMLNLFNNLYCFMVSVQKCLYFSISR